jgi:Tfp pilus assembly protein FimT
MKATRLARRRSSLLRLGDSETGSGGFFAAASGFTLLEMLLALGLLALIGTVLIGGSTRALNTKPVSTDELFWKSCGEARKLALQSGREVRLGFADDHEKGRRFTVDDGMGAREFPLTTAGEVGVNFLSGQKVAGSAVIMAGQVVETQALPFVTFYSDGTCTAFRVQIRLGVNAHILSIDPWTCAPVLPAENGK